MHDFLRSALFRVPVLGGKLHSWYSAAERLHHLAPGHFYSPIASDTEIDRYARVDLANARSIEPRETAIPAIDVRLERQQTWLRHAAQQEWLSAHWARRYRLDNEYFQPFDAIILRAIIRHYGPSRIVEVGSGFSTLAILDALDDAGAEDTRLTVIEPHADRLLEHLPSGDRRRLDLRQEPLGESHLAEIEQLAANDLLFVDSSHVYKIGSDVQLLFERVYPSLAPGVLLHIHDVFFPFDYPASWLRRGDHFNEAYVLRAFLQYNTAFEILLWNDLMRRLRPSVLPTSLRHGDGHIATSFWLQRRCPDESPSAHHEL